jgi:hypothetical protein
MKNAFAISFILSICFHFSAQTQGCIAIRNLPAGFGQFASLGYGRSTDKWMLDISNRYFESATAFQGKTNKGYDGVNLYEYMINFSLTRLLDKGWALSLDMPIASNTAATPSASGTRHSQHAVGLGDMRLTVYKWILNTNVFHRGNIQFGLGIKFPTGNYHTEDYFYYSDNPVVKSTYPVNVAIQLGDGGTGFTTQLNGYYIFSPTISVFGDLFYLISPVNTTGVAAWPPGMFPPATDSLVTETTGNVNSVPDNYTINVGANIIFHRFVFTGGLKYEGAPAHDLIGENDGRRIAGHIFSVEPGAQYKFKRSILYFSVSIPVDRAAIPTVPDERWGQITGVPFKSGGHYADVLYYFGYTFTF